MGKNVRALFKDYLAFNDTTTDELTKKVKNDLAKKIVNNLLKKLEGQRDADASLLKKIGKRSIKSLMTKVERQNAYNLMLDGFDLEKALEDTLEYVTKNFGKIIWEEGKNISIQVIRELLPGNPAILGLDAIKLTANSLDALSKFMIEKQLENVKPMIFCIENFSEGNVIGYKENKNIPSDALVYNGHHYYVYSNVAGVNTWEDAKKYCENLGGHLAVINDKTENDALYDYITRRGYKTAYFGLSDSANEGNWKWLDNSVTYYNWFNGEPNGGRSENYAEFYYKFNDGRWNDGNFGHGTQTR